MRKFGKTDSSPSKGKNPVDKDRDIKSSIKENWLALTFGLIVIIAVLARTVMAVGISADNGFALSGQSAAEHKHAIISILTGTFGLSDPSLNYPFGGTLMQPPLVDIILAGFAWIPMALGASASTAASAVLALSGPTAAAFTVLLVYYLGKEMFDRNIGIIAAFFFAVLPLSVVMSVFSDGTTMGILVMIFVLASLFVLRAMKALEASEDRTIKAVLAKDVLKYVLGAGALFAFIALSWNAFSMIIVLLVFMMAGHAVISRLNSHDFGSVFAAYAIMLLMTLGISLPYYYAAGLFSLIFTGPLLLAVISVAVVGLFYAMRKKPKLQSFVIPILATVLIFAILYLATPQLFNDVVSGNAIFESSIVASLLTPTNVGISKMASYYGWATVWMPFVIIALLFHKLDKNSPSESHLTMLLWITGVFLLSWLSRENAIMAGAMYSVAAASVLVLLYRYVGMSEYFKTLKGGGWKASLKKFLRPEPFVTLVSVVFLVIAPNAMLLADATTSSNQDVGSKYLGGIGYTVDTDEGNPMNMLWDDYYNVDKEGALATWFEYSSKSVDRGGFTSVTSDSGQGATAVSNILLAEGSAGAVSAMTVRMILADGMDKYKDLMDDDLVEGLKKIIDNPSETKKDVLGDQEAYPGLGSDLDEENAVYLASVRLMTSEMTEADIHEVYKGVRERSDGAITYVVLNASMLPMYKGDGTMFSTLAYLNDYAINSDGSVSKYYEYSYIIDYMDAMFESFIWKAMMGINDETGINYSAVLSLLSSDGSVAAAPGLGLGGFEVDYWQVKYNPNEDAGFSDDGWVYMDGYKAVDKQKKEGGLINYFSSLIVMKVSDNYETETGQVTFDGTALEGAKVAVFEKDPNGILVQRSTAFTDEDGNYSVLVPVNSNDYEFRIFIATEKTVGGTYLQYNASDNPNFDLDASTVTGSVEGEIGDLTVELLNGYSGEKHYVDVSGGEYTFNDIAPGKYTVTLRLNGKEIDSLSITAYPGSNSGVDFDLSSTLKVTVKDIYGAPVENETVVVQNKYDGSVINGITDENGLAEFKLLPSSDDIANVGEYIVHIKDKVSTSSDVKVKGTSTSTNITVFSTADPIAGNTAVMAPGYSSYGQDKVYLPDFGDVTYTLFDLDTDKVRTVTFDENGNPVFTDYADTVTFNAVIKSKSDTEIAGSITFYGAGGTTFTYASDEEGKVTAKLPAGDYTVHVIGKNGTVLIENDVNVPATTSEEPTVFKTDDGRTLKTKFTYSSLADGTKGVPFVNVTLKVEHDGKEYTVYATTDASGGASVTVPKSSNVTVSVAEGEIGVLSWEDLSKDATTGTSAELKVAGKDISVPEFDDLTDMWLWSSKTDKTPNYGDKTDVKVTPGTYYLVELNGTEYTYSKVKVYFGQSVFFTEPDTEVTELRPVEVDKPENSTVSVEIHPDCEDAEYFKVQFEKDGDLVYLMTEGTYLFKATEGDKISYMMIDVPADDKVEFDLKDKITLKGYLGVSGNGLATIEIGGIELFTKVKDGSYSVDVPQIASSAEIDVELKYKPTGSEYTYGYAGSFTVNIPDDLEDEEKTSVTTNAYLSGDGAIVKISDELEITTNTPIINGNEFQFELTVNPEDDAEGETTYAVKAVGPWKLDKSYVVTLNGSTPQTISINGVFSPTNVDDRDAKMKVSLVSLEGKTVATGEIFDIYMPSDNPKKKVDVIVSAESGASPDLITDNEYMYAITFRNYDNGTVKVKLDLLSDPGDDWIYAVSDEMGRYLLTSDSPDNELTLASNTKTVLYVKLMNSVGGLQDVPDISVGIDVITPDIELNGGATLDLVHEEIKLSSKLSVEGNNVYHTGNAMQPIFWVFTVLSVIMIVLVVWTGSKRGVFTRRK